MIEIIKELQRLEHYSIGSYIEIAKGKNEYIFTWSDLKRKTTRIWQSRK